jgi:hypothetical protein
VYVLWPVATPVTCYKGGRVHCLSTVHLLYVTTFFWMVGHFTNLIEFMRCRNLMGYPSYVGVQCCKRPWPIAIPYPRICVEVLRKTLSLTLT